MKKQYRLGINLLGDPHRDHFTEQLEMLKAVGWEAFFTVWEPEQTDTLAEQAARLGLVYQSIHAPCKRSPLLWRPGSEGDAAADELVNCVTDCGRHGIPVTVIHPCIGYNFPPLSDIGLRRFARVIETAERYGVTVGFENLEGEEYLAAVMNAFGDSPACGFCFDTGHERCHNHGRDMMALYGEKLCMTHLNDNLGRIMPEDDTSLWGYNDLHLPPGDGIVNWKSVMDRIDASPYQGPLMCELKLHNFPGRHEHDAYRAMPLIDFYTLALKRAKQVRDRAL